MSTTLNTNLRMPKQGPTDTTGLKQQLQPLSPLALEALRIGLEERNPHFVKIWLYYLLAIREEEKEETSCNGLPEGHRFIKFSEDVFIRI